MRWNSPEGILIVQLRLRVSEVYNVGRVPVFLVWNSELLDVEIHELHLVLRGFVAVLKV